MEGLGSQLEAVGWRQGRMVKPANIKELLTTTEIPFEPELVLLVASQSCDIANNSIELDPCVEFSVGRRIHTTDGNFTYNKNPRVLHLVVVRRLGDGSEPSAGYAELYVELHVELKAHEKISVTKERLARLEPDNQGNLDEGQLRGYVGWLAARYSRPALPSTFNDRLRAADRKNKLRRQAKTAGADLLGVYVELFPETELDDGEHYTVNLLGLLPENFAKSRENAESVIAVHAEVMTNAGMRVNSRVVTEAEVSIAAFKTFKRFNYDDLSYREDSPLPPDARSA